MKFDLFQDSRIGARSYQEDRVAHWSTRAALLMVIADGMGGHRNGEMAAQIAVDTLGFDFKRDAKPRVARPEEFVGKSLAHAHAAIQQEAKKMGLPETPATVAVACLVQDGMAYWNHVGDSRLYLLRHGRVVARTKDHSRVQQLVDQGRIREEAIPFHPDRNKLTQCLGASGHPKIGAGEGARLQKDDIVLLCSDGLWGPLSPRQLVNALIARDVRSAVAELVALAESRAGTECDNVSAVAMCWGEEMAIPATEPLDPGGDEPRTEPQGGDGSDTAYLRMSDEDIERAIADIRAAVRRNKPGGTG